MIIASLQVCVHTGVTSNCDMAVIMHLASYTFSKKPTIQILIFIKSGVLKILFILCELSTKMNIGGLRQARQLARLDENMRT